MKYYPVFLRIAERPCVVIGGGKVAEQKVESLLRAGATVVVISPEVTPRLAALAAAGDLTHHRRVFSSGDLRGCFLAYAATNDDAVHAAIVREAATTGALLNVVDRPQLCDFIVPSVMQRGDLLIATSTSGASPALAKRIRRDLEDAFGPEYDLALQLLRRLRDRLSGTCDPGERQRIFTALVDSPLLDHLRAQRSDEVNRLLAATVGADVSLASLGMELQHS